MNKPVQLQGLLQLPERVGLPDSRRLVPEISDAGELDVTFCSLPASARPTGSVQTRSKRSACMTLLHAATKSVTNCCWESSDP